MSDAGDIPPESLAKPKRKGNPNWVKGMTSPNPTGRPKGVEQLLDKVVDWTKVVQFVYDVATGENAGVGASKRDRLRAAEMLMDRKWGKPTQTVAVTEGEKPESDLIHDDMPDEAFERVSAMIDQAALEAARHQIGDITDADLEDDDAAG